MQFVSSTTGRLAYVVSCMLFTVFSFAQVNSPFSRYGIGNLVGAQHTVSRSMGGLQASYADGITSNIGQSINFNNPASYGNLFNLVTYDLGLTIDSRNLKSANPAGSFSSIYFIPAYAAVAMPISKAKGIGFAFGLKPISRINYSIANKGRLAGDSAGTLYSGTGGFNQAFIGIGKRWKKLNIGFNTGYSFGRRETNTQITFFNDTVSYYQSNQSVKTNFGKMFLQGGIQYEFDIIKQEDKIARTSESYAVRVGAIASFQQNLNATQDINKYTFGIASSGAIVGIDTVLRAENIKGNVVIPATYEAGATLSKRFGTTAGTFELWSIGLEFATTQWTRYRFYNQPDALNNSWVVKLGAQISPNPQASNNYLRSINYRLGFNYGQDYINADGNGLKTFTVSLGAGLPIRKWRAYETQYTTMQTALQIGKRGSSVNNITENYLQLSVGFSLSDIWFIKRKYD
jgi:hypothetical protein